VISLSTVVRKPCPSSLENFNFQVVQISNLAQKPTTQDPSKHGPFEAPFEDGIFISEIGAGHFLLFNKFAVVPNHLLVVSNGFVPQSLILTKSDFLTTFFAINA
jgi:ATP adenylyltransferase